MARNEQGDDVVSPMDECFHVGTLDMLSAFLRSSLGCFRAARRSVLPTIYGICNDTKTRKE